MMIWLLLLGCPIVTETKQADIRDRDGDGFDAISFGGLDCNDDEAAIHPLAEEIWYDGIDDNCDGNDDDRDLDGVPGGTGPDCDDDDPNIDDERYLRYLDTDDDGFGTQAATVCPGLPGYADVAGDCDDTDPTVSPDAEEIWYDGVDDDCDGNDDDRDGDDFRGGPFGNDCDDDDPTVQDERVYYVDGDNDGFGSETDTVVGACEPVVGQADNNLDCADNDSSIHPDALEICDLYNQDENCNGLADDDDVATANLSAWYADDDGDGFGTGAQVLLCDGGIGFSPNDEDCDDDDPNAFPGALWYIDRDGDRFGQDDDAVESCSPITGRVSSGGDCNDRDPSIHPDVLDDEPYDFVDADCAGDTDVATTREGYPTPVGSWSQPPDWVAPPLSCGSTSQIRDVGAGQPYATIQEAIDDSAGCDIVAVHAGRYAPFVVHEAGLVITAVPGEEVVIWAGGGIQVTGHGVVLAELQLEQATTAIDIEGSAFLDRLTLQDNLGNIRATGDLSVYGLSVTGGVGAIARSGEGNLQVIDSTFDGVLGLFGVIRSADLSGTVELRGVQVTESTGGFVGAISIIADSATLDTVSVHDGAGPALQTLTRDVTAQRLDLRDNVVFDDALVSMDGTALLGGLALVHDLRATGNNWVLQQTPSSTAFIAVDGFPETFIDNVALHTNSVDLRDPPADTRPVWLRSVTEGPPGDASTRTLHHILVAGFDPYGLGDPTGVGILSQDGDIRQATLVGLDAALWSVEREGPPPTLTDSIAWDVGQLYLTIDWNGLNGIAPSLLADIASDHPDCVPCANEDPAFLRYHPNLPGDLWDLRLRRSSPYYAFGEDPTSPRPETCLFDPANDESPTELQLGAYGDHGITPASLASAGDALAAEDLAAADLYADPFPYDDCDLDGMYDSWESTYQLLEPDGDRDLDGLDNLEEFELGTIPSAADTDADGRDDLPDSDPLDPDVQ